MLLGKKQNEKKPTKQTKKKTQPKTTTQKTQPLTERNNYFNNAVSVQLPQRSERKAHTHKKNHWLVSFVKDTEVVRDRREKVAEKRTKYIV